MPEQRRAGEAPAVRFNALLAQVPLPDDLSARRVQAKHIAPFQDGEHAISLDGRRRAGAAFIILRTELRGVSVLPNYFSAPGIETPEDVPLVGITHRINPPLADGEGGETRADRSTPEDLRPVG